MARPTSYKIEFDEHARQLCLLGGTDKMLAEFFSIDESTLNRWKKKYESFRLSIRSGKLVADAQVAEALFKKSIGFTQEVQEAFDCKGNPQVLVFEKYFPPDTSAARFWLNNRQKEIWRDRQSVGIEFEQMSDSQLDEIINRLKTSNEKHLETGTSDDTEREN